MTDLTPKQIEDTLTDKEWGEYNHLIVHFPEFKDVGYMKIQIECFVSLAEARIENKRLKNTIDHYEETIITHPLFKVTQIFKDEIPGMTNRFRKRKGQALLESEEGGSRG